MPRYWLFKTEPRAFSFEQLREDGTTPWTGVRNFQARNNMMEMRARRSRALLSLQHRGAGGGRHLQGRRRRRIPTSRSSSAAANISTAARNRTNRSGSWSTSRTSSRSNHPVTLARMRAEPRLVGMALLKRGQRLSVQPVMPHEWKIVLELADESSTRSVSSVSRLREEDALRVDRHLAGPGVAAPVSPSSCSSRLLTLSASSTVRICDRRSFRPSPDRAPERPISTRRSRLRPIQSALAM